MGTARAGAVTVSGRRVDASKVAGRGHAWCVTAHVLARDCALTPLAGPRPRLGALEVARRDEAGTGRRRRRPPRLASWPSRLGQAPTVSVLNHCAKDSADRMPLLSAVLPSSLAPGAGLFNVLVLGSVSALVTGAVTLSSRRVRQGSFNC